MAIAASFMKSIILAVVIPGVILECGNGYNLDIVAHCDSICVGGRNTRRLLYCASIPKAVWHILNDTVETQNCDQTDVHRPCRGGSCACLPDFDGDDCDGGRGIADSLRPQFNPVLDPDDVYKEESWYDGPVESGFNRVCYIKVATENAPGDAIVAAISYKDGDNDSQIHYGNFSTGPVDSHGDVTGLSRFACLKVRCPGWTIDGTSFNVNVDVAIQSTSGDCNVTSLQTGVPLTNETNRMSLTLVEGDNYGPQFGIYYASGYRQQAEYFSEHVCYSGRQYDFGSLNPSVGVVATFSC